MINDKYLIDLGYRLGSQYYKIMNTMGNILGLDTNKVKDMVQAEYDEEVSKFICDKKGEGIKVVKNGTREREFVFPWGVALLKTQRLLGAKFESKVLRKWSKFSFELENFIAVLITQFLSYESIISTVETMIGIRIGHSEITKIANKIKTEYISTYDFEIEQEYKALFIDACYYKVKYYENPKTGEVIKKMTSDLNLDEWIIRSEERAIYTAIGITQDGYKQMLAVQCLDVESSKNWYKFLESLVARGMESPEIIICDDFKGINNVIKTTFPETKIQKCVIHKVRNAVNHVSKGKKQAFKKAMRIIYTSPTKDIAKLNFVELKKEFNPTEPEAVKIIENSLDQILEFLDCPVKIRSYIYTNNISENFNSGIRRYVKEKCSFQTEETLLYLVIIASLRITRTWSNKKLW